MQILRHMATEVLIILVLIILPMRSGAVRLGPHMAESAGHHQYEARHEEPTAIPTTRGAGLSSPPVDTNSRKVAFGEFGSRSFSYMFGFFPKGVPIPPSGSSKGHNSFTNRVRPDRTESP